MRIQGMRRVLLLFLAAALALPGPFVAAQGEGKDSKTAETTRFVPPGPKNSTEIGDFYFKRKEYRGALSRYKEALQEDPHYAPAYRGLGRVYEKLGMKQKALQTYQTYLDELPSKQEADEAKDVHRAMERLRQQLAASSPRQIKRH
ncbi:MAG TPA: tetratricopeptide repeat protein [Terriglobia bacterium]|nr:tetratricopeptide repeat protein [Terriglobia bacterium]